MDGTQVVKMFYQRVSGRFTMNKYSVRTWPTWLVRRSTITQDVNRNFCDWRFRLSCERNRQFLSFMDSRALCSARGLSAHVINCSKMDIVVTLVSMALNAPVIAGCPQGLVKIRAERMIWSRKNGQNGRLHGTPYVRCATRDATIPLR